MTALRILKLHMEFNDTLQTVFESSSHSTASKMHSITLDTAASVLLLSSIVSIGLLLKRTPKSRITSSNSVLSISDVSSSVLTAVMLLVHQFYIDHDGEFDYSISKLNNTRYFYETAYKSRADYIGNSSDSNDDGVEDKCDYKSVLLQYAMFLIPFANAFISLLSFSASFYANAMGMNCRCCKLIDTQNDVEKLTDKSEKEIHQKGLKTDYTSTRADTRKSKFLYGNHTNFAIIGQWIIPALFTGVFQFGEYRKVDMSNDRAEDLICTITANFPFENCFEYVNSTSGILTVDSVGSYSSVQNYVSSEDNLLWPHPNSTEAHEVVSKIYSIVQSAMNDSKILNATLPDRHYNISQLLDIMNHEKMKNTTAMEEISNSDVKENLLHARMKDNQKSYVMHSFTDKVLNDNEQSELNNVQIMRCLKNRCILSTKFLKIHLFILLSLIYFAPILISALILMKSYYKCREITEKLQNSKLKLESEMKRFKSAEEETTNEAIAQQQQSDALQLGWFTDNASEEIGQEAAEDVGETEQSQPNESYSAFEKIACELSCETEKMQSLFKIFKVNAMVAVALWTPFFLQILSKVFLCSNVPNWLMETTFLATIVFAIFKNAVNVNVIKIEADAENLYKHNTVHPTKFDL